MPPLPTNPDFQKTPSNIIPLFQVDHCQVISTLPTSFKSGFMILQALLFFSPMAHLPHMQNFYPHALCKNYRNWPMKVAVDHNTFSLFKAQSPWNLFSYLNIFFYIISHIFYPLLFNQVDLTLKNQNAWFIIRRKKPVSTVGGVHKEWWPTIVMYYSLSRTKIVLLPIIKIYRNPYFWHNLT